MPVTEGNRNLKLGDLFEVQQDNLETPTITINGDAGKVKRIGQTMRAAKSSSTATAACTGEKMSGGKSQSTGTSADGPATT